VGLKLPGLLAKTTTDIKSFSRRYIEVSWLGTRDRLVPPQPHELLLSNRIPSCLEIVLQKRPGNFYTPKQKEKCKKLVNGQAYPRSLRISWK